MTTPPPPAWYPDPADATYLRWWDGTAWTAHRTPLPSSASTHTVPKNASAGVDPLSYPTKAQKEGTQTVDGRLLGRLLVGVSVVSVLVTFASWVLYATYDEDRFNEQLAHAQEQHRQLVSELESLHERINGIGK